MKSKGLLLIAFPILLASGCAFQPATGTSPANLAARHDPDLLRGEEMDGYQSALQAVRGKRSAWLRIRGDRSVHLATRPVQVYFNGIRLGGPYELDRMAVPDIASLQYFDGQLAYQRWGQGHENGVIVVTGKR